MGASSGEDSKARCCHRDGGGQSSLAQVSFESRPAEWASPARLKRPAVHERVCLVSGQRRS